MFGLFKRKTPTILVRAEAFSGRLTLGSPRWRGSDLTIRVRLLWLPDDVSPDRKARELEVLLVNSNEEYFHRFTAAIYHVAADNFDGIGVGEPGMVLIGPDHEHHICDVLPEHMNQIAGVVIAQVV